MDQGPRLVAEGRLLDLLTTTQRLLSRGLGAAFLEEGATVDQWRVLCALGAPEGQADSGATARTMGELAELVQMPAASLTRTVDALADSALVYRRPSADDGRKVTVRLSERGVDRLGRLDAIAAAHLAALASVGDADVVDALSRRLVELRALLDTAE